MNTLTKSCRVNDELIQWIKAYTLSVDSFKHVFLFGSVLKTNKIHNDIDVFIIYEKCSALIIHDLNLFSNELEQKSGMLVDITSLSIEEEKEIQFLDRIKPYYLQLK